MIKNSIQKKIWLLFIGFFIVITMTWIYTARSMQEKYNNDLIISIYNNQLVLIENIVSKSYLYQFYNATGNKKPYGTVFKKTINKFSDNLKALNTKKNSNITVLLNDTEKLWNSLKARLEIIIITNSPNLNIIEQIKNEAAGISDKINNIILLYQKKLTIDFLYFKIWLVVSLLLTILLVIFSWFMIKKYMTKPLEDISSILSEVTAGEYDLRINYPIKDEIGQVVNRINYMLEGLENINTQRLEAMKQFAGIMAHKFNNLLTVINGYTDLLLLQMTDKSPYFSQLQEIHHSALKATSVVQQLLVFSRGNPITLESISLNALILDMKSMLKRLVGQRIELKLILNDHNDIVNADKNKTEQLILNLVLTARDSMPDGGKITIELKNTEITKPEYDIKSGNYLTISINYTGELSNEIKNGIFEPFSLNGDLPQKDILRLISIYSTSKQHGGYVVFNGKIGFTVYLPIIIIIDKKIFLTAKVKDANDSVEQKNTILLVEDDESVLRLAELTLSNAGYKVISVKNGEEAFNLFTRHAKSIDILLSDVVMPGMGGVELVSKIKDIYPDLKAILMSGYTDQNIPKIKSMYGIDFINKPFSPMTLINKVKEVSKQIK